MLVTVPLMYQLDFYDICFFMNSLKHPTVAINILDYISFTTIASSTVPDHHHTTNYDCFLSKKLHNEFLFQKITQTLELFTYN